MKFNDGYQPTHNPSGKIYSYMTYCSLETDDSILVKSDNNQSLMKLVYFAKDNVIISVFVNVVEKENDQLKLTENLIISKKDSFQKHFLCKKGIKKEIKIRFPFGIEQILKINSTKQNNYIDNRYKIIIRMEPKKFKHRFVNLYYFDLSSIDNKTDMFLIKQKIEIKHDAYYIYDIFGLENLKRGMNVDSVNKYCKICLDNTISVIIVPCRHMCLCLVCAKLYNQKGPDNKQKMSPNCPICRQQIKGFINIQGLKEKDNQF